MPAEARPRQSQLQPGTSSPRTTATSTDEGREACGYWQEVTLGGKGEVLQRQALHGQRWIRSPAKDDQEAGIGAIAALGTGAAAGVAAGVPGRARWRS
ncbi:MAG: hypothetical protein F4Y80_10180 [Caldilineaceae bacterium SB0665_bin_21]|nr:hypothetical protein [Caldilineaceae bacterium SB0665_bin_21]MYA03849.1 hypothetical protein [Caldilineaceae bacterium SB0664_bin_22]MYC62551.1 hypothetical protein [Caldilineaceae bacterium SB0661_bin_34]